MLLLLGEILVQQSCQVANWAILKSGSSGHHITQWLFGLSGSSITIFDFKPFSVLLIFNGFFAKLETKCFPSAGKAFQIGCF